jgi:hypothetical protein
MKRLTTAALFALMVTALAQPAAAGLYRLTGDVINNATVRGSFEITIDEASEFVLTSSNPGLSDPLEIDPWYGYDVTSATVTMDGFAFTEADLVQSSPTFGGPAEDIYVEGAKIGDLETEDFLVYFEQGSNYLFLGFGTGSLTNVVINQVIWQTPTTSGATFENDGYANIGVALIPEPASAALLALGGLALMRRR